MDSLLQPAQTAREIAPRGPHARRSQNRLPWVVAMIPAYGVETTTAHRETARHDARDSLRPDVANCRHQPIPRSTRNGAVREMVALDRARRRRATNPQRNESPTLRGLQYRRAAEECRPAVAPTWFSRPLADQPSACCANQPPQFQWRAPPSLAPQHHLNRVR